MKKQKKILKRINKLNFYLIFSSLILIATVSILIDFYFYSSNMDFLSEKRITDTKQNLSNINNRIMRFTQKSYDNIDEMIVELIKDQTHQGKTVVENILFKYENRSPAEKLEHIENALRVAKFFNGRGYYFIMAKDGEMIFNSVFTDLENTMLVEDEYILDAKKVMQEGDEGIFKGNMRKPGYPDQAVFLKWSYLARIDKTDWYIGTGEYYFDFIEEYKNTLLQSIMTLRNKDYGFFYIIDLSSNKFIVQDNEITLNHTSIRETEDKIDDKILEEAIKVTQKQGQGFIDFHYPDSKEAEAETSYVHIVKIPELNWLMGAGVYKSQIDSYFESDRKLFINKVFANIIIILTLIILIVTIFLIFNKRVMRILNNLFETLESFFKDSIKTDQLMNKDKLKYDEFINIANSVNQMLVAKKEISDRLIKDKVYVDQLMIENPEAIALVDKNSNILKINPAFTKVFGYNIEECRNKNIDELLCDSKEITDARIQTQMVASGRTARFYAKRSAKSGKVMNMFVSGVPVMFQGQVEAVFAIYQDKTEIIEHDIALKIASENALESAKTKSQFLANMSHEIRTPMNGVIGMTELLTKTKLSDEQNDYVETIKASGESLLRVINDILDFSKLESGKYNFNYTDFELSSCIEKSLDVIALKVQEKGVKVSYSIEEDVPIYINSDFDRLKQVLINLLNNSYKFTSNGMIRVNVKKIDFQSGIYTLMFEVLDTGIGIPKDKLSTIFDSFSQVDSSSSRSYTGTGLGLAISKAIVTHFQGKIWVESKLNVGSKVHFTFKTESRIIISQDKKPTSLLANTKIGVIANQEEFDNIKTILTPKVNQLEYIADCDSLQSIATFYERWDVLIIDYYIYESFIEYLTKFIKGINNQNLAIIFLKNIKDKCCLVEDFGGNTDFVNYPIHKYKLIEKIEIVTGLVNHRSEQIDAEIPTEILGNIKILVAEDNSINQKLMQRLFHKIGITIDLAKDGQEALDMAIANRYDIIFMDIQMPRLDGLQATEMIKESLLDQAPIIVALTANVLPEDKEKCIDSGMVAFLPKPIKIIDIEMILSKFIRKEFI